MDDTPLLNNNFSSHKTEGFVNDNNDEGSNEILDDDIFEELSQEAFLIRKIFIQKTWKQKTFNFGVLLMPVHSIMAEEV